MKNNELKRIEEISDWYLKEQLDFDKRLMGATGGDDCHDVILHCVEILRFERADVEYHIYFPRALLAQLLGFVGFRGWQAGS